MKKIFKVILIIFVFIFFLGFTKKHQEDSNKPTESFRVYLKGKEIGQVKSKDEFLKFINKKQKNLKQEFNVQKIYEPDDLFFEKTLTYDKNYVSFNELYDQINRETSFTLSGYEIKLKGMNIKNHVGSGEIKTKDSVIYVLDKKVFKEALKTAMSPFVSDKEINDYNKGYEINLKKSLGEYVSNIDVVTPITITKKEIPVKQKIYTDVLELSKALLYGANHKNKNYVVKVGDTIEDIAFENKMSTVEFLIGNPNLRDENQLLYPGQSLKVSTLRPMFNVQKTVHKSEVIDKQFKTNIINDPTLLKGVKKTEKKGKMGKIRTIAQQSYINGVLFKIDPIDSVLLEDSKDEVVRVGTKKVSRPPRYNYNYNYKIDPSIIGTLAWPTNMNCRTTSGYGYRWGGFHNGVDIQLTSQGGGKGSPIYSIADGVVLKKTTDPAGAKIITIKHEDGLHSLYAHLDSFGAGIYVGKKVTRGEVIGTMGNTGYVVGKNGGVHLHFTTYIDTLSNHFNPQRLYPRKICP